jgi:uncharacterized protein
MGGAWQAELRRAGVLRCKAIAGGPIMRTLRILAVLLLIAGAAERVRADDAPSPEALAAANELFTILSADLMKQLTGQMTSAFWPVVEQKARAGKIDDATIAELRSEFERIQISFVTDAMKDAPPIYARHFSVAELRDLIAFYRTPTGAKALREMPQVMGEFATQLVPRMQDLQNQTTEAFNRVLKEHGYGK